jgi:hypothetical protein
MAALSHTATSSERDEIGEKAMLSHTVSSGAVSMSPELFEKARLDVLKQWEAMFKLTLSNSST